VGVIPQCYMKNRLRPVFSWMFENIILDDVDVATGHQLIFLLAAIIRLGAPAYSSSAGA